MDRDVQLLHACMQVLTDFMEQEAVNDPAWNCPDRDARGDKEQLRDVYRWWKEDPFAKGIYWFLGANPDDDFSLPRLRRAIKDAYKDTGLSAAWALHAISTRSRSRQAYFKALAKLRVAAIERQNQMLKTLIDCRKYLWT